MNNRLPQASKQVPRLYIYVFYGLSIATMITSITVFALVISSRRQPALRVLLNDLPRPNVEIGLPQ